VANELPAVILLGGQGTRLRPLTWFRHKSLVPLLGEPFLAHVLRWLKSGGVGEARLALGSHDSSRQLAEAFPEGEHEGVLVRHFFEEEPLDSAGGVRNASRDLRGRLLVINGDIYTDLDLQAMIAAHESQAAAASIALLPVENTWDYGVVQVDADSRVVSFVEKPPRGEEKSNLINAGVWLFEREALDLVPPGRASVERFLFPTLVERGFLVYGHRFEGEWVDIGSPDRYRELELRLVAARENGLRLGDGSSVSPAAAFAGANSLGSRCVVQAGARVKDSVLWDGVVVEQDAAVEGSVLAKGVVVRSGARVERSVLGDGVIVGAGEKLGPGAVVEPFGFD
jgi:mannose-1-phosphate guanylyltransferase